jgi:hypothetical protein
MRIAAPAIQPASGCDCIGAMFQQNDTMFGLIYSRIEPICISVFRPTNSIWLRYSELFHINRRARVVITRHESCHIASFMTWANYMRGILRRKCFGGNSPKVAYVRGFLSREDDNCYFCINLLLKLAGRS